ncbi:retron Ec48 family effector membrane protein [Janthinobacterium aestuarii]
MNRISKFNTLLKVIVLVAILGYGFALMSLMITIFSGDLSDLPLCFRSECIKNFSDGADGALLIGKATSDFLMVIATAGGILVALWNYFTTMENSALANHISHFSTFQTYLNNEITKRNRINVASVDTFRWYNAIFPASKFGNIVVGEDYKKFVRELNLKVTNANLLSSTPTGETFRYKPHQTDIKSHLNIIGISISLQPRIEYYEIEDQIFSLILCVNNAFCVGSNLETVALRQYA